MTQTHRIFAGLAVLVLSACGGSAGESMGEATPAPAAEPEMAAEMPAAPSAYFSAEQANRGQTVFRSYCSECHYTNEFTSDDFKYSWRRDTARDLYDYITDAMPESAPGSLSNREYVDVLTYILELNGLQAGSTDLTPDAMSGISLSELSGD